jgi:uncharacterized membrane protein
MAFCGKCGSPITEGTAFCSRCGAPLAATHGTPPPVPGAAAMAPNVAALLSYVLGFITGILFLVLEPYKNDRFVRFHAFQSIFYSVVAIAFSILWSNLVWVGFLSIGFLFSLFSLIGTLISLGFFLYWLFLMYKAYNGERYLIPVLGEFAAKQAGV